jgi:hypothetical protein
MIYSKQNDFLFIKGAKVAGTSVEMALSTVCGPEDIITPITPADELERLRLGGRGAQNYSHEPEGERAYLENLLSMGPTKEARRVRPRRVYTNHMSLREFVERYASLPSERIFCVERSPYAKIISGGNMSLNIRGYKYGGGKMESNLDALRQPVATGFERMRWLPNIDGFRNADGKLNIRVLRFEALTDDFAQLMRDYGISPAPTLPHAKQGMNSNGIDPREIFTRTQLDKINEIFAEEFDTFGYQKL